MKRNFFPTVACRSQRRVLAAVAALALLCPAPGAVLAQEAGWVLVGWNNLGMHCMDGDYSVFSLLPPYNTIHAQLIDPSGRLVQNPGAITVTYEAVADPQGSINTTSVGKTNFWAHAQALFGATLPPDVGLTGLAMPGSGNTPQAMGFDAAPDWFVAEGIPITPYDDQKRKNPYPMMRLVARDGQAKVLASTDIVLPVSDEMSCTACHASGSGAAARPLAGWVNDPDPQRDMRLNILRLHDEREGWRSSFQQALVTAGYSSDGLYATATVGAKAILCAACHGSNALPGTGLPDIPPLTQAIHRRHAAVVDPETGMTLDAAQNRAACYRCHPGSLTRCLRGAMGAAVAADGTMAMQCQSCHGSMMAVASPARAGWFEEPRCQSCHTGTAVTNNGQIRYQSVFEDGGAVREAVDDTFATTPDTPAAGLSLYRFSTGHGGLECSACHGSTHAEFPSTHTNDNRQSVQVQGHPGMLAECDACHAGQPQTVAGGPHGLHPLGAEWVDRHADAAESGGVQACKRCHGADHRGTVLSRALGDRVLSTKFGQKHFWPGFQVGCYACHAGPDGENASQNHAPAVDDKSSRTTPGTAVDVQLTARDADANPLALRIVSQPAHGTAGLDGTRARYFPDSGFEGEDHFTYAAWDGSTDSNLGSVAVTVGTCAGDCNQDSRVTVDEIMAAVHVALGHVGVASCNPADRNHDNLVAVEELVASVRAALRGCSA